MRPINADALKEFIEGAYRPLCDDYHMKDYVLDQILTDIENEPAVDAEPQWIPCSERLPENMELVNVTWVNRDPEPYYMNIKDKPFTATGIYFKGKWYWYSVTCKDMLGEYGENEIDEVADGIDIVAWMPLPEPYEGESE